METNKFTFLEQETLSALENYRSYLMSMSSTAMRLFDDDISLQAQVVIAELAGELVQRIPETLIFQVVREKLQRPDLFGIEETHFEKLATHGNLKDYFSRPQLDNPESEYSLLELARQKALPLEKALSMPDSVRFIPINLFGYCAELNRIMANVKASYWGYGQFNALYDNETLLENMGLLDTAINLENENTIIPVRAFGDAYDLIDSIGLLKSINGFLVGCNWHTVFSSDDVEEDRKQIEKRISVYVDKYPFLKNQEPYQFGKIILRFFTQSPARIVEMLGENVICFPYTLPQGLLPDEKAFLKMNKKYKLPISEFNFLY